jgi:hypothetical protein
MTMTFVSLRKVAPCALGSIVALSGCRGVDESPRRALSPGLAAPARTLAQQVRVRSPSVPKQAPPPTRAEPDPSALERCRAEWARLQKLPALPGAPKLEQRRAETLARAKGEPVIFLRPPEWERSKSVVVRGYRQALARSRFPWDTLRQIRDRFRYAPEIGRQVLLRDGYLYADHPDLAWSLWDTVRLEHLFDEPALSIERGSTRLRAVKDPKRGYVYDAGPDQGKPARILLFDRVTLDGEASKPPLHLDARSFAHELGFDRLRVERMTADGVLASLRFGDTWVKSVLDTKGARLGVRCEIVDDPERARLTAARARAQTRARVLAALRSAMLRAVDEELPFDEPKTEWGQQDGHLENHWRRAYEKGETHYSFQSDLYPVFRSDGRPAPPQVCIDFVTQTLERASGTWWRGRGEPPGRDQGGLDFDALIGKDRRKVTAFLSHARTNPEAFDYRLLPTPERIPYVFKREFYRHLAKHADAYAPGTIVIIRGYAPWDHFNVPHFHAFFVYETDPVTGVPMLLAGNAGRPRIQSWEPVMSRAPQRSIEYRITPKLEWLAPRIPDAGRTDAAPPLVEVF